MGGGRERAESEHRDRGEEHVPRRPVGEERLLPQLRRRHRLGLLKCRVAAGRRFARREGGKVGRRVEAALEHGRQQAGAVAVPPRRKQLRRVPLAKAPRLHLAARAPQPAPPAERLGDLADVVRRPHRLGGLANHPSARAARARPVDPPARAGKLPLRAAVVRLGGAHVDAVGAKLAGTVNQDGLGVGKHVRDERVEVGVGHVCAVERWSDAVG
mmetsp:Transcript_31683/g.93524  ORF Transcript_31683/g.93524 Transcript_31683/m.93524 type:complete len:214 (+) Transcript_31683:173-814(+)